MDIRTASFAALACLSGAYSGTPATARLQRPPTPEKYPGQRQAFRQGAWAGDGVPSKIGPRRGKRVSP